MITTTYHNAYEWADVKPVWTAEYSQAVSPTLTLRCHNTGYGATPEEATQDLINVLADRQLLDLYCDPHEAAPWVISVEFCKARKNWIAWTYSPSPSHMVGAVYSSYADTPEEATLKMLQHLNRQYRMQTKFYDEAYGWS